MLALLSLRSSIASAAPCPDNDLDGYANCNVAACNPSGLLCGDCNDSDNQVYPGRAEVCNQKDDDCDAIADEGSADVSSHAAINDVGAKAFDQAGNALTGITDVTGDGVPDIVVGVQLHDGPTASFNDIGALETYSGRTARSVA